MREASRISKQAMSGINAGISSSISGIRVTKAFNNSELEMKSLIATTKILLKLENYTSRALRHLTQAHHLLLTCSMLFV